MNHKTVVPCLLVAALAACQSSPAEPEPSGTSPAQPGTAETGGQRGDIQNAAFSPTSRHGAYPVVAASAPAPRPLLSHEEYAILRDPKFKQRFVESYIAETDIEPSLTEEEREDAKAARNPARVPVKGAGRRRGAGSYLP